MRLPVIKTYLRSVANCPIEFFKCLAAGCEFDEGLARKKAVEFLLRFGCNPKQPPRETPKKPGLVSPAASARASSFVNFSKYVARVAMRRLSEQCQRAAIMWSTNGDECIDVAGAIKLNEGARRQSTHAVANQNNLLGTVQAAYSFNACSKLFCLLSV